MTDDRFTRAKRLLLEAADLPENERGAYLDEACKGDPELRKEVDSLLSYDADQLKILDTGGARPQVPGDSLIGRTISHFKILGKLGVGGMGVVYKAEDTSLKRTVALKFLPPELTRDPGAKARFLREAQAAAALDHTNICAVHEIGDTEALTFIAMAYVEGRRLKDMMGAGPLELAEATDLSIQIAEGLRAAHEKGVVHRDIKPGNVMVTPRGQAKITDFGLAKLIGGTDITTEGSRMGTVAYMSPEQARGDAVDHRTDIWSLGAMLYEMSTGQRPFRGDHDSAVIYSILNEEPGPMSTLREDVPQELQWIVGKAMAKNPDDRYQTATDMLAHLTVVRDCLEAAATAGPLPSRPRGPVRAAAARPWAVSVGSWGTALLKRHKVPTIIAAVVIAVGLGSILLTLGRRPGLNVDPNRVVVGVFENRTGDESLDHLGALISDWITEGLSQTGLVKVVPTTTVLHSSRVLEVKAAGLVGMGQLRALAEYTEAGTVVSGTYYSVGDSLRLQARITDAQQAELISAVPSISGPIEDPMEAIHELRQRVMGALAVRFDRFVVSTAGLPPPRFGAYREYALGMALWQVDFPKAARHFSRAAELDSTFMTPRFWLINAYIWLDEYAKADSITRFLDQRREWLNPFYRHILDAERAYLSGRWAERHRYLRQAEKLAGKPNRTMYFLIANNALKLNRPQEAVEAFAQTKESLEDLVLIYGIRATSGFVKRADAHHMLGDYEKELQIVRAALEHYPDVLRLRVAEARALAALGRIEGVNEVINASVGISSARWMPREWTAGDVMIEAVRELRAHGHAEPAREIAGRAVTWYQDAPPEQRATEGYRSSLARALYQANRWEEAKALYEELAAEHLDNVDFKGYLGALAARAGGREEALKVSAELEYIGLPYLYGNHTYQRARIASLLGEPDKAIALLREHFAQGGGYYAHLHCEIDFEPLWDYPPFQELIRPKG